MNENIGKKPELIMIESAKTLGECCIIVGGCPPDLQMTLEDFIESYGRNGIIFSISKNKILNRNLLPYG